MNKDSSSVNCPNCGTEINVSEILYSQIQSKLKEELEKDTQKKEQELQVKLDDLQAEKTKLSEEKSSLHEQVNKAVKEKLVEERIKLENSIREDINKETSLQIDLLQKELTEKSSKLKELNETKAEVEKLKREKDEIKSQITLEKEIEFSERLKEEKTKAKIMADESSALKIKELEIQLDSQKKLVDEMKRKSEQGSMQLQGEVQELVIEDILRSMFPFDVIGEVAKGVKGADVVHTVRNKMGSNCGTILYESKRTKSFSAEWINKLKVDALHSKADICSIVTESLPDGIEKVGQKDGVWICSFNDFKGLVLVLRDSLLRINEAYSSQTNKGDKMQMLYDYLLSTEFRLQVSAIIEGFTDLQNSYNQEKRAMERIWKQREKQLEKVLLNTNHFIGSVQGIAGNSIPGLKQIGESDNILEIV